MSKKIPIEIRDGVEGKVCTGKLCGGIWKPLDQFYPRKNPPGYIPRCIECENNYRHQRYGTKPRVKTSSLEVRDGVEGKVCVGSDCGGVWKPLDQFHKGKSTGGRATRCRECEKAQYRRKHGEPMHPKVLIEVRDGIAGKVCTGTVCGGVWKPLDQFYTGEAAGGKMARCKICTRVHHHRRKYPDAPPLFENRDGVVGKVCTGTTCGGVWKPLDQFPIAKKNARRGPRCIECQREFEAQKQSRKPRVGNYRHRAIEIHDGVEGKICIGTTCGGIWKPLDQFDEGEGAGGRTARCKECRGRRSRAKQVEIRDGVEGKVCNGTFCGGIWKPLDEFYTIKDRRMSRCKACLKQAAYERHPPAGKHVKIEIRDGVAGKRCSGPLCNREVWHPLSDFAKGSGEGGKRAICRDCKNAIERQRRERKRASAGE